MLVCLSLVGVAAGSSLAGNGPAPKATGDIWFTNPWTASGTATAPFVFNAIQQDAVTGAAKGNVFYADPNGSYTAQVTNMMTIWMRRNVFLYCAHMAFL